MATEDAREELVNLLTERTLLTEVAGRNVVREIAARFTITKKEPRYYVCDPHCTERPIYIDVVDRTDATGVTRCYGYACGNRAEVICSLLNQRESEEGQ